MNAQITEILIILFSAIAIAMLCFPLVLRWSLSSGFTDKPGTRKLHKQPVPVAGGISIAIVIILSALLIPGITSFFTNNIILGMSLAAIAVTGFVDDRINMSAYTRLLIEIVCALGIAYAGIRIESFHGVLGFGELPLIAQYAFTVLIIVGITNAYNLIDGIDGLAGSLAIINMLMFSVVSYLNGQYEWTKVLAVVTASLLVFLKYNWRPAKMFLGDAGSLLLGFLMSITAIHLLATTNSETSVTPAMIIVLTTASLMIPVIDTLRVFTKRIQEGKSPFSADKTHLHHKLIQHFMIHSSATKKLTILHIVIISATLILSNWLSITLIILLQSLTVVLYTNFLDFAQSFSRWYRFIKRLETNN